MGPALSAVTQATAAKASVASSAGACRISIGPAGEDGIGVTSRAPIAGRDDLEIIKGNGSNGCTYVMAGRLQPSAPAYVRAQVIEAEDEEEKATQPVSVQR